MSVIRPQDSSKLTKNPEMTMTSQFSDMTSSSNFFNIVLFLLSNLVTGPRFMSISALVLEIWQFSFIRDSPEIRVSEIPPSEFFPISGDRDELWIPNLARLSLIECYWTRQNSRVTAFTAFELLRENQLFRVKKTNFSACFWCMETTIIW